MTLLMREEESIRKREAKAHAETAALLQKERDLEAYKCRELQSRLNVRLFLKEHIPAWRFGLNICELQVLLCRWAVV